MPLTFGDFSERATDRVVSVAGSDCLVLSGVRQMLEIASSVRVAPDALARGGVAHPRPRRPRTPPSRGETRGSLRVRTSARDGGRGRGEGTCLCRKVSLSIGPTIARVPVSRARERDGRPARRAPRIASAVRGGRARHFGARAVETATRESKGVATAHAAMASGVHSKARPRTRPPRRRARPTRAARTPRRGGSSPRRRRSPNARRPRGRSRTRSACTRRRRSRWA